MRTINNIVVHCTATSNDTPIKNIENYWKYVLGWKSPGYHYVVDYSGVIIQLQNEAELANGVRGHNKGSIHVAYIGGVDRNGRPKDTRSVEQQLSLLKLLLELRSKYTTATIKGHRDFPNVAKACPSFDVAEWLKADMQTEDASV